MASKCVSIARETSEPMAQAGDCAVQTQMEPIPFTAPPDACMWLAGYGKWYPAAKKENVVPLQTYEVYDLPIAPQCPARKKVRFVPIFLAILSLLIVAVAVVGKFVLTEYLALLDGRSGLEIIMKDLPACFKGEVDMAPHLVAVSVAIVALASVINFVVSLVGMFKRGASKCSKICIFFMFIFSVALLIYGFAGESIVGYGLYAFAGVSLLAVLFGYLSKNN